MNSAITLMTTTDMQTLAYTLGVGLLIVAVLGIVKGLSTPKSGRTYGASLDTNY